MKSVLPLLKAHVTHEGGRYKAYCKEVGLLSGEGASEEEAVWDLKRKVLALMRRRR